MAKKTQYVFLLLSAVAIAALIFVLRSVPVSAASYADGYYVPATYPMSMTAHNGGSGVCAATTWNTPQEFYDWIKAIINTNYGSTYADNMDTVKNGGAGTLIINRRANNSFYVHIRVGTGNSWNWSNDSNYLRTQTPDLRVLWTSGCEFAGNHDGANSNSTVVDPSWTIPIFISTVTRTYPDGYEGLPLDNTVFDPPPIDYADSYSTTSVLELKNDTNSCDPITGLESNWYEDIFKPRMQVQNHDVGETVDDYFVLSKSVGGYYLSQQYQSSEKTNIVLVFSTDSDSYLEYDENGVYFHADEGYIVTAFLDSSCNVNISTTFAALEGIEVSKIDEYDNVFVGGNVDLSYPEDYNGDEIVTVQQLPEYWDLKLRVVVNGGNIKANIYSQLPQELDGCVPKFNFYIVGYLGDGDFVDYIDEILQFYESDQYHILYQQLGVGYYYNWELNIEQRSSPLIFGVEPADIVWSPEVVIDGVVINPDDGCNEAQMDYIDQRIIIFRPMAIEFYVNGENRTYDNDNSQCENGVCQVISEYEDCSISSVGDLVDFLPCTIGNFMVRLKNFFVFMFIPNTNNISKEFNVLMTQLDSQLGFVGYPVVFIVDIYSEIRDSTTESCSFTADDIYGEDLTLNMCQLETAFPAAWTMAITLFRVAAVITLVFSFLGLYYWLFRISK